MTMILCWWFMYKNVWLAVEPLLSHTAKWWGEQHSISSESSEPEHWQSCWGENIFHYEICMVYSAQNMSPLFQSELLSMICLLWKMHVLLCLRTSVQPNLSSIREKSKHRFSARNNSSSLRCVCFPKTCVIVNKGEILLLLHKNPPISSGLAWRYTKENNSLQWIPFCVEYPLQHQSWKYTG